MNLKGRPISGDPDFLTQQCNLSNLIEILIKPLFTTSKPYMKDDSKLPTRIPIDCTMYSYNISNLFTSIPTEFAVEAVGYWLH